MSLRLLLRRGALGLAVSASLLAVPAVASAASQSFSITPCSSPTCTPSSTSFHANGNDSFTLTGSFDSSHGTPTGITTQLAPGVLSSLAANPLCLLGVGGHTTSCQVGTGTVSGPGTNFNVYLAPPTAATSDVAGFDLVAGPTTAHAELALRQLSSGPGQGQEVGTLSLPSGATTSALLAGGTGLIVNTNGNIGSSAGPGTGAPFTRMPTTCSNAVPSSTSVTYSDGTTLNTSATPDFDTSSTCHSLGFSPAVSASATKDQNDNGVAVQTNISQLAGQTTPRSSTLNTPSQTLSANPAALSLVGKQVGTATASSPLLPQPISGPVLLTTSGGALQLTIQLPACAAAAAGAPCSSAATTNLVGAINPVTNSLTFATLPDVPLTSLTVQLNSNPQLFTTSCAQPVGTLTAGFTGQNSPNPSTATASTQLRVNGCPSVGPTNKPKLSGGKLTGLGKGKPRLSFRINGNGTKVKAFSVKLPGGLSLNRKKLRKGLKISGGKIKTAKVRGRTLVVTLKGAVGNASVTVRFPALRDSKGLRKRARKRKIKKLTFRITVTDSSGKKTPLTLTIKKPR